MLKALGITREGQKPKGSEEKTFAELALEMIEKAKKGAAAPEGEDKKQSRILPKPEAPGSGKDIETEHVSGSETSAESPHSETESVFD